MTNLGKEFYTIEKQLSSYGKSENTDWTVFPFNPGGYTNNQNNLENMGETKKVFWKKEQKKPSGLEGRRAAGEPDQNRVESP